MVDIKTVRLCDLLPVNIRADPDVEAAAQAIDRELQSVTADVKEALLLPRLDELPESVLDLLAWQWHVDFYEPIGLSLDKKRALIRQSIAWHRYKGTPAAVEEIVRALTGCEATVREWFEYNGDPYMFKVHIITPEGPTDELKDELIKAVYAVKNTRSHLEGMVFLKEPIPRDPLLLNHGGPPIVTVRDLSYDEVKTYSVFTCGLNATNRAELRTRTETITKETPYRVFTGERLGGLRLNRRGQKRESVERTEIYVGERVKKAFQGALLNGRATLNQSGTAQTVLRDMGEDKTTEVTLFASPALNGRAGGRLNCGARRTERRTQHYADLRPLRTVQGGATLNDAAQSETRQSVYETVERRVRQKSGHGLNAAPSERRVRIETETKTQPHKVLRPFYALNRCGAVKVTMKDVGRDETVESVVFTGPRLNCGHTQTETITENSVQRRAETHFSGPRLTGRGTLNGPPLLNAAPSEARIVETEITSQRRVKRALPGAFTLNGQARLNASERRVEVKTQHVEDWRAVKTFRGASLLNATAREERSVTVHHEKHQTVKRYPAGAHLLNSKKGLGYINI